MTFNVKITDDALEKEGAWVSWELDEGIRVKMIRSTTDAAQKKLQTLLKKNRKALRNSTVQKQVMISWLCNDIIKDWEGITEDDKPYEYNPKNAVALLETVDDFYNWVLNESQNILNFAEEDDEDTTLEERGEELKKS
jgi:hypothetical protein